MVLKINEKNSSNGFEAKILQYLRSKTSGSTITDIAKGIAASRTTISKYISILELKGKVIVESVGAYNLYFNAEKGTLPKKPVLTYYKGLISNLKKVFPKAEKVFKEIGKKIAESNPISLGHLKEKISKFIGDLQRGDKTAMKEVIGDFSPYNAIFKEDTAISNINTDKFQEESKIIVTFSNLDTSEDFVYHHYLFCGYMGALFSKELKTPINCDIDNINIEESSIDFVFGIDH